MFHNDFDFYNNSYLIENVYSETNGAYEIVYPEDEAFVNATTEMQGKIVSAGINSDMAGKTIIGWAWYNPTLKKMEVLDYNNYDYWTMQNREPVEADLHSIDYRNPNNGYVYNPTDEEFIADDYDPNIYVLAIYREAVIIKTFNDAGDEIGYKIIESGSSMTSEQIYDCTADKVPYGLTLYAEHKPFEVQYSEWTHEVVPGSQDLYYITGLTYKDAGELGGYGISKIDNSNGYCCGIVYLYKVIVDIGENDDWPYPEGEEGTEGEYPTPTDNTTVQLPYDYPGDFWYDDFTNYDEATIIVYLPTNSGNYGWKAITLTMSSSSHTPHYEETDSIEVLDFSRDFLYYNTPSEAKNAVIESIKLEVETNAFFTGEEVKEWISFKENFSVTEHVDEDGETYYTISGSYKYKYRTNVIDYYIHTFAYQFSSIVLGYNYTTFKYLTGSFYDNIGNSIYVPTDDKSLNDYYTITITDNYETHSIRGNVYYYAEETYTQWKNLILQYSDGFGNNDYTPGDNFDKATSQQVAEWDDDGNSYKLCSLDATNGYRAYSHHANSDGDVVYTSIGGYKGDTIKLPTADQIIVSNGDYYSFYGYVL